MPVWDCGLTLHQSKQIEAVQRLAVAMILNNPNFEYGVGCTLLGIEPLYLRREQLALFAMRTADNPKHSNFFKPKTVSRISV